ncbi:DNA modification methylase [Candidatus Poribacteria bacterium]|nr:MAG: DNA modification methylase [Candidatus Poribacteria bacterium]
MIKIEDIDYLTNQLITYIGNKRSLLNHINKAIIQVKKRTGKSYLRVFDAFSGSGVVSRFMKAHASYIASNDFEDYAVTIARCYLQNRSSVDTFSISKIVEEINNRVNEQFPKGFIERLYAPKDELNITSNDRVFYTQDNARRLDNYRRLIEEYPLEYRDSLIAPLLSKASVHSNTSGVFKGFYKNRNTGIGQYGGTNSNALSRIKGQIMLEPPILSQFECDYEVFHDDTNKIASQIKELDLTYIDPPYNQHPYGSNYFMLNLLVHYKEPINISKVSGIPKNWKRSGYNVKTKSKKLFNELLHSIDTKFFLISFNNEGFISPDEMRSMLKKVGSVEEFEIVYNTFRGSRNLRNRNIHVTEQLFLVERNFNGK